MKCRIELGFIPHEIGLFESAPAEKSPIRLLPGQKYGGVGYDRIKPFLGKLVEINLVSGQIQTLPDPALELV